MDPTRIHCFGGEKYIALDEENLKGAVMATKKSYELEGRLAKYVLYVALIVASLQAMFWHFA